MQNTTQTMNGWAGTILHVDLTRRSIKKIDTARYCREYIGGLGIGLKLYWDYARPDAEAFHPDSPLLFMTGPLAATPAPSASRLAGVRQVALRVSRAFRFSQSGRLFCR